MVRLFVSGCLREASSQGHHGLPLHRRRATSGSGSLLNSALASSQGHERYERRDGALFFRSSTCMFWQFCRVSFSVAGRKFGLGFHRARQISGGAQVEKENRKASYPPRPSPHPPLTSPLLTSPPDLPSELPPPAPRSLTPIAIIAIVAIIDPSPAHPQPSQPTARARRTRTWRRRRSSRRFSGAFR